MELPELTTEEHMGIYCQMGKRFAMLLLLSAVLLSAQVAVERGGNIVVTGHGDRQLTSSGQDCDPSLSADGQLVVFVHRSSEGHTSCRPEQQEQDSELWVADASGKKPPQRVLSGPVEVDGRRFKEFSSPRIAPTGDYVYFLVRYAPTTWALVRLSLGDHSVRFIAVALEFQLVGRGNYAGDLIIQQRRPYANAGYYTWYWLFDPNGKEMGLIGPTEEAVKYFLATIAP